MFRTLGCLALAVAVLSCDGFGRSSTGITKPTPAATKLTFTTQPSDVSLSSAINPAVVVAVQNDEGQTALSSTVTVTMTITEGTGTAGAVLNGTITAPAINGVATFNNLRVDRTGTGFTLTAIATDLAPGVSTPFNVVP